MSVSRPWGQQLTGYGLALLAMLSLNFVLPMLMPGDPVMARLGPDAVLAASIFHFGTHDIASIKAYLAAQGIPVRPVRARIAGA